MKLKKILYLLIIFLILLSKIVYAENKSEVFLNSNKTNIENGEEIEISFAIQGEKVAAYLLNIYFDNEKMDFISGPENISLENGKIKILWYDEQGGNGAKTGELGNIVLKAKKEGLLEIRIDGELYNENCELIETESNLLELEIGSLKEETLEEENVNLEMLAIENEIFYPAFDNSITNYNVEVSNDITNLNILAIPENEQASVIIKGNENLVEGNNTITVAVTSSNDLKTKKYTLNIYKRNKEEEAKYEEQQSHKKEALDHAYELEKTSSIDENQEIYKNQNNNTVLEKAKLNLEEKNNNNNIRVLEILSTIFIILSIICGIIFLRKNKNGTKE